MRWNSKLGGIIDIDRQYDLDLDVVAHDYMLDFKALFVWNIFKHVAKSEMSILQKLI